MAKLIDTSGVTVFEGTIENGGSQPGAVRVLKHAFDFTQAGALAAGVPVFTPTAGDVLLDAWIESPDEWAGGMVTPIVDIGVIAASAWSDPGGFFNRYYGNLDLTAYAATIGPKLAFLPSLGSSASPFSLLAAMVSTAVFNAGGDVVDPRVRFLTTDPLSLVVSGDGQPGSPAFDGSAGASTLYLIVSTPGDAP